MWIMIGALSGFVAVAAGAFGAHALEGQLSAERLAWFELAARYQLMHAPALLVAGLLIRIGAPRRAVTVAGVAFLIGTVLFCGSLYTMALSGVRGLGAITPFGGVAFLVGWAALAWAGWWRARSRP